MTNTITIVVAMIAAMLFAFVAGPLQALAQVSAGGTVGTGTDTQVLKPEVSDLADAPKIAIPELEPDLSAIPDLSDVPEPELPDIPEPDLSAIPNLSDVPEER